MSNLISQSEVDAFLTCRRRHYYAHIEKIKPKKFSEALTRGTIGHEILEAYYRHLKDHQGDFDGAEKAARKKMDEFVDIDNLKIIQELAVLLNPWFPWAKQTQQDWIVLEVEEEKRLPVPGTDLTFPFKMDLLIQDRKTGRIFMVDHKFVRDFYHDDLISVLPQMAKYIGALRRLGVQVHDGMYQMIRTRPLKDKPITDKMRLQPMNLKDSKVDHYIREQFSAMIQIQQATTAVPQDVWRDKYALRSANQFNCRNCPFLDLCGLDLINGNRDLHIATFYEPNDYGYEDLDESATA